MLTFKKNIYEKHAPVSLQEPRTPIEYYEWFDPYHFIKSALLEEMEVFRFLDQQPVMYWHEDGHTFYPHSYHFGSLRTLKKIINILFQGLEDKSRWYQMNAYHFCLMYDVLARFTFNYNHDNELERLNLLPELKGKLVHFTLFVDDYFSDTAFLVDPETYNSLSGKEKKARGWTLPSQFGAVNGLMPDKSEMELTTTNDYPYTVFV